MAKKNRRKRTPNPHRPPFQVRTGPSGEVVLLNLPADLDYADELIRGWSSWFAKARDLLSAASLVEPHIHEYYEKRPSTEPTSNSISILGAYGSYFMLIAFAIENLCKGQLLRERPEELRATLANQVGKGEVVRLPEWLKTHDLLTLARNIGFAPRYAEADLLKRLTFNSVWFARYPLPTDYERFDESFPPKKALLVDLAHPTLPTTEIVMDGVLSCYYNNDIERTRVLLEKIRDLTERKRQP